MLGITSCCTSHWSLYPERSIGLEAKPASRDPPATTPNKGNDHLDAVLNALMERGEAIIKKVEWKMQEKAFFALLRNRYNILAFRPLRKGVCFAHLHGKAGCRRSSRHAPAEGGLSAMSEAQRKHAYQACLCVVGNGVDGLLGYF